MEKQKVLNKLREQVNSDEIRNEVKCGKLLKEIAEVLLTTDKDIKYVNSEQITESGRTDLIVFGESSHPDGGKYKEAYLWELKAPQLSLFRNKSKSQAKPTIALYDAETQLMHYLSSLKQNGTLLKRWQIDSDNVHFGGLIIGKESKYCSSKNDKILCREAYNIRNKYFYKQVKFKVYTWEPLAKLKNYLHN